MQRLKDSNQLSPLEDQYHTDIEIYKETLKTAANLSQCIMEYTNKFAIFKFFKPYPHTPSDVDALFFLSKKDHLELVNYLINNGYYKIGECPSQVVVYDHRDGYENMDTSLVNGKKGGKYYIDLYRNVSASHFIYIDVENLEKYVTIIDIDGEKIQTLRPMADLAVVLTHSIVPEQLFTLGDYYTALYYINEMDTYELNEFIEIVSTNRITNAVKASLTIIKSIHKTIHGFVPNKVEYLNSKIGIDSKYVHNLSSEQMSLPYRYNISTLLNAILERMKTKNGMESMVIQTACTLTNPKLAKWIIYNLVLRRTRNTY